MQSLHTHTALHFSGPSVLKNKYSAGWDAEYVSFIYLLTTSLIFFHSLRLMLSVFKAIADGPTIDDLLK